MTAEHVPLNSLVDAGVAAALAPLAAKLDSIRATVAHQARVEELAMRLAMVTAPRLLVSVSAEVERREAIFADAARSDVVRRGHPRISALESVLQDVYAGRIG